jgi:hypothetical protein
MAYPVLNPLSTTSRIVLTETGSYADVQNHLPFGIYGHTDSPFYSVNFITGAVEQVGYTYKKLGGDVLDIEITAGNVYAAYEEATLEYSSIINFHQVKNSLSQYLGSKTGSFDSHGTISGSLSGSNIALRFPYFNIGYAGRVAEAAGDMAGVGRNERIYSASFDTQQGIQDYDLQAVIYSASLDPESDFYGKVGTAKVYIKKVFYKTPAACWRMFSYYGGLGGWQLIYLRTMGGRQYLGNNSSVAKYGSSSSLQTGH